METQPHTDSVLETRQRLMEAAGEVFAEVGFRAATIREICRRAGTNVASINYHFRDKQHLYEEVLKYAHSCASEKYPPTLDTREGTPEDRLRAHIRLLLLRIFDRGRHAWHGKLMSQEMINPTPALDALIDGQIRQRFEYLKSIIRELLGAKATDEQVTRCTLSIVGQCMFYHHAKAMITRLYKQDYESIDIESLAEHVTRFSLGALAEYRKQLEGKQS